MWTGQSPLWQFPEIPPALVAQLEWKFEPQDSYSDLPASDLDEMVKIPHDSDIFARTIRQFPCL
jgi:hypothetical protein